MSYVDGEAIEQEDDECFGVARCHGFSSLNESSEHPMKSIAAGRLPSSRFFEQQDARMFSSRQLYGSSVQGPQVPCSAGPIRQRTIAILARSSLWRIGW